jgi:cell division protein FtsI (penicillin-binding protein 3)
VQAFEAIGAVGMVMDVRTGEILALVSLPDFDPNHPGMAPADARFNRATLGTYEMGSTFKIFTIAGALDAGSTTMKGGYDATHPIKVGRFSIEDYHAKKRYLTTPEIFVHSSNIGSAKMAVDMGVSAHRHFLESLGFTAPAAIELPEVGAPLWPRQWREVNSMTIAFGHGMAVSPLQLVAATAAMVNGGVLHQPTLLRRETIDPQAPRVISPHTSADMRALLRMVVAEGTGKAADVPGYLVGGKTGTAEKSGAGGYQKKALLSSFIGAFPIHEPRYVVLAMIDEPKGNKETQGYATGGWVAAPAVSRIVKRIGPLMGVEPVPDEAPQPKKQQHVTDRGAPPPGTSARGEFSLAAR